MADPQTENGYTRIANELLEAMIRQKMSSSELRILLFIARKTYGFSKTWDRISYSQFSKATGINRNHVYRSIKNLKENNVVECRTVLHRVTGKPYTVEYKIQKDHERWRTRAKAQSSPIIGTTKIGGTKNGIKVTPKMGYTKERKKTTYMSPEKLPNGAVRDFLTEWNTVMKDVKVSKVKYINEIDSKHKRYKLVMIRLREPFFRDNYKDDMMRVVNSDFCNGTSDNAWVANVDWFLRHDKVMEILERKFDNRVNLSKREPIRPSEVRI